MKPVITCPAGHRLTEANTISTKAGRGCRVCHELRAARKRRKRRAA